MIEGSRLKPVEYLEQYIGIKEGSKEHKSILAVFNNSGLCKRYKMTTKDAWCATSVSAAFIASGLTNIFPCVECSCAQMIKLAKKAGIWIENDAYVPKTGDVILYDWHDSGKGDNVGTPDHVGIVVSVCNGSIKIIEGNYSDTVKYRYIKVNGKYIRGFIAPKYSENETKVEDQVKQIKQEKEEKVKKHNMKIDSADFYNKSIAGTYKTISNLNLRTGVGKEKQIVAVIPKGHCVSCYGYYSKSSGKKWLLVAYKTEDSTFTGFCSNAYLKKMLEAN